MSYHSFHLANQKMTHLCFPFISCYPANLLSKCCLVHELPVSTITLSKYSQSPNSILFAEHYFWSNNSSVFKFSCSCFSLNLEFTSWLCVHRHLLNESKVLPYLDICNLLKLEFPPWMSLFLPPPKASIRFPFLISSHIVWYQSFSNKAPVNYSVMLYWRMDRMKEHLFI